MTADVTAFALVAPLAGWLGPLDEAPDAVFADRLIGDGVAIDPTATTLHAPCAGTIIAVSPTRHAVTLRTDAGAELLLHVGIDTVALGGAGFTVHVADGARVAAGDVLLGFDLDVLAARATSLLSPIVVTNGDAFTISARREAGAVAVGAWLMDLTPCGDASVAVLADGPTAMRRALVAAAHGIHARPAAAIATAARGFAATTELSIADRRADARSSVAVMTLGLVHGAAVDISATGVDAEAAVAAISALIERGEGAAAPERRVPVPVAPVPVKDGTLRGVRAAPGLAIGVAFRLASAAIVADAPGKGVAVETERLADAIATVRANLTSHAAGGGTIATIAVAHLDLLDDPAVSTAAGAALARGASAAAAWRAALAPAIAALGGVADARIAGRADDLRDLEAQVVAALRGADAKPPELPENAIVCAVDLLPSQLMALDPARLAGIVLPNGGPTSHVAIIAASLNIPMIVAAGEGVLGIADGTRMILDADAASLAIDPSEAALAAAAARVEQRADARTRARAASADDCRMADGARIEVFANLGSLADAHAAVAAGAEGCGLLRTELLFLDRATPPDVAEQTRHYQCIVDALGDRPLIVRTLDIGGDKPAPYLALPPEENPALGLRGIRVGLARPQMLEDQLRAILAVRPQPRILLPMIASVAELIAVRAIVDALATERGLGRVELGVMIETPAAAVTADLLATYADFFAIGTNDLAQYTLAMDRGNPAVASGIDALHPAILRLIAQTCEGAARHARPVGVCGGLASDLAASAILIGFGVTELSAVPAMVPEVKAMVRTLTREACTALAHAALACDSAAAVRALVAASR
ncbi:phosphoenolpyruvate--protein phosphotransferase [Polymorphobacter sp. PAMC 29334]|uniref:phosphoenolpyruvate--protein phosphotransferase n=1 Tax=Polymorphobacter sp. PAMC 29334 TaxID=2862331 RepID=UPI001C779BB8|nr:phosphoenolpyruvate--protein phosphotransferase [Polymorphobacter sp. PAMC 29334]QYE33888.1 phosphoenolpyruvate--protein phosphotransferase [Polymorphobacter sp. PAMC 29334]